MSDEEQTKEEGDAGAPAWVMTFADLMSLLMCFFVLLLAFSEMDAQKFKQLSGSMKQAFGVQRQIKANDIPKGTSIIAMEFSPGIPQPTPIQVVEQETSDDTKDNLEFSEGSDDENKNLAEKMYAAAIDSIREEAEKLVEDLKEEIETGMLEVEWSEAEITVRLKEKSTFNSGEAKLKSSSFEIIDRVSKSLNKIEGNIIVAGHSDNVPISTYEYRSNWELSAARAANVVHHLTKNGRVDPYRVQMRAHAETKPLVPNDSLENKASNRRVEIVIVGNNHLFDELHNNFGIDDVNQVVDELNQPESE
ncbi:MAG: MotB family protein [Gammaproteobacteria bacterium]|nr:MotB family protein [Gammaproteobacteria bacterium]